MLFFSSLMVLSSRSARKKLWKKHQKKFSTFKKTLLPELLNVVAQVGVKEIHREHWEDLADAFPNMNVIVTGRDPRDIYISLFKKYISKDRWVNWKGPFTPQTVAENLDQDFKRQRAIVSALDCMKIRYEDFCTHYEIFEQIKAFLSSDIPDKGIIGGLAKKDYNTRIHGQEITDRRVYRWQCETDRKVIEQAHEVFKLLKDYCEFWGYRRESMGSSATAWR